ncbi:hypothetical protein BMR11_03115 [Methylococcaceae bacterium CS5]|nr:hypothetical protein BMR10_02525 [Methylococcaceae bacterium CS4]TXL00605.1 hypothetical protein BMR11_03115 [Methylococcaceae bacterium CS5]
MYFSYSIIGKLQFKECINCGMVKQLSAFSKDDKENDGASDKCILCEELYKSKMEPIDTVQLMREIINNK